MTSELSCSFYFSYHYLCFMCKDKLLFGKLFRLKMLFAKFLTGKAWSVSFVRCFFSRTTFPKIWCWFQRTYLFQLKTQWKLRCLQIFKVAVSRLTPIHSLISKSSFIIFQNFVPQWSSHQYATVCRVHNFWNFKIPQKGVKAAVMQIGKTLINGRLHVSKVFGF